jgi:flagellar hook-length control protein FliK
MPTVAVALDLLVRRGATNARMTLRPEALGGVDVHLRHTSRGLDVRLSAEGAEAGRALAASADELRRRLEDQGVTVLRLEIVDPSSADGSGPARDGRGASGDRGTDPRTDPGATPGDPRRGTRTTLDLPADPTDPRTTLALPDGTLVDVLA